MRMPDMEGHVCQSCGMPMGPDDYAGGSEQGDYCSYCVVHGEYTADRENVKQKIADKIQEMSGKPRSEAESEAEQTMSGLKRWQ
ncbi:MAG: zinc ribbon domain-containing protein [Actinomycetota bacterium]